MSASGAAPHPVPPAKRDLLLACAPAAPFTRSRPPPPPPPGRPRPAEPAVARGLGTRLREPPPAAGRRAGVRRGSGALTLLTRKPSLSTPSSMSPRAPAGPAGAPGALTALLPRLPRPLRPGSASAAAPPWPASRARSRGASRAGSHARSGFLTRLPPRRCARVRG